jgi:hypothetical protein
VSFRLENEKWGEVFKMHPVLNVRVPLNYNFQIRDGLEMRIFVTIKQFEKDSGLELDPAEFLGKSLMEEESKGGRQKKEIGKTLY